MLVAKSKVAPIKQLSIPRLELCGMLLGSALVKAVIRALNEADIVATAVYGWTDSTIALAWIADTPRVWNTFVANRVAQIQEVMEVECWHHVGTAENAADLGTRGLEPGQLEGSKLWWQGPEW